MYRAITLCLACALAQLLAPAGPAVAAPKLIGYVFAGTYAQTSSGLVGSIETLGVRTDYTLAPEGEVTVPGPYIVGLGLVHTPSGISLYAQDSTTAIYNDTIYQFTVNPATGARTAKKPASLGRVTIFGVGNNLGTYDGFGLHGFGAGAVYALSCKLADCSHYGLAHYAVDPNSGKLKLSGPIQSANVSGFSLVGDHLDAVTLDKKFHDYASAGLIDWGTGDVAFGPALSSACCGKPVIYARFSTVTAAGGRLAMMVSPLSKTVGQGLRVFGVSGSLPAGDRHDLPQHKADRGRINSRSRDPALLHQRVLCRSHDRSHQASI